MKKLIILLLIIGCSTESKKDSKIKFEDLEGVWYTAAKEELKLISHLFFSEYLAITKDSISAGGVDLKFESGKIVVDGDHTNYYGYGSFNYQNQFIEFIEKKESPEPLVLFRIEDNTLKEVPIKDSVDKIIYSYNLDSLANDTLYCSLPAVKYFLGDSIVHQEKPYFYSKYHYTPFFKLPKYSSAEARLKLKSYREDLELQLITQKQYDSIKNELKKYIK